MSRIYTVVYSGTFTSAGGDVDWLGIKPAANKPIRLRGLILSQISEVGDAAEEGLNFDIIHMTATVTDGSGGGAVTPAVVDENDAAAGFTCRANDTTIATTSGTATTRDKVGWNNRNSPFERWWPDDRFAPRAQNAGALVVRQQTALIDDMTGIVTAYIEEY